MSVIERVLRRDHERRRPAGGLDGAISLTPLRKRDLRRGVLSIESACHPRPWTPGVFQSEIEQMRSGTRHYLVARHRSRRSETIVGYAGLWFTADEAHVTNVAVEPSMRRQGVARALLLALADVAIERGASSWTLEVRVSSDGAQALYREFGFAPAGVRKRYYENAEDALVMWCHEIGSPEYRTLLDSLAEGTRTT